MKKLIFTVLLIGFLSSSFSAQSKATSEDYKIYTIILREIYKEELENNKQEFSIVIQNKTVKSKFFDFYIGRKAAGLRENFRQKNKTITSLEKRFSLKFENYVVSKNELDELLKIGRENAEKVRSANERKQKLFAPGSVASMIWKPFHEKFPKASGYYSFSRIGFSSTKKIAAVQVYGEGAYWSSDSTYILMKIKKGWKIYTTTGTRTIA